MDSESKKIVQAATRLFAALGFDATTTELIAASAGVDTVTVRRLFPSNVDLYRKVIWRASEAEREALADAVAAFEPTRQAMDRLLDDYLDFYARNPDLQGLWLHRRTGDAGDTADLDRRHSGPRVAFFADALRDVVPSRHLDYLVWTFPWVVQGFFGYGTVHADGRTEPRGGPLVSDRDLENFREYLHLLAHRLLALPDAQDVTPH